MKYIRKHLHEGEHVVQEGHFHWLWYARAWAALLIFGWLIIGIVYFIYEMIRLQTTEFGVTNRSVVMKKGFLSAHVTQLSLEAVEGAKLDQGIIGRIFGFGGLDIEGRGEGEISFPTMANPSEFLSALNEAQMAAEKEPVQRLADEIENHDNAA
ncbi:MAG: PH domain-containing protein [Henriciella sp.]|uniref:PH domain-containing protein n=1 Tax=Henriciella sp. TaxID=1968823 RepID=UPI003C732D3E